MLTGYNPLINAQFTENELGKVYKIHTEITLLEVTKIQFRS